MKNKVSLVFVGQKNFYTEFLVDWLSQLTNLHLVIWTASHRHTGKYKRKLLRQRIKRTGLLKCISEIAYYVSLHKLRSNDTKALCELVAQARKDLVKTPSNFQQIDVENLKDTRVMPLLEQIKPDLILTQCINEIISEQIYTLPKIGCFVYHEGIVPQYRGKFATHWAIVNGDYENIGASLIRVQRGLDTGPVAFTEHVLPQGTGRRHGWWEHEVLFLALPRLKKWLEDVSAGHVSLHNQVQRYPIYSYPVFSHLLTIKKKIDEYEQWRKTHNGNKHCPM